MKIAAIGDCTGAVQDSRNVTCEPVISKQSTIRPAPQSHSHGVQLHHDHPTGFRVSNLMPSTVQCLTR